MEEGRYWLTVLCLIMLIIPDDIVLIFQLAIHANKYCKKYL